MKVMVGKQITEHFGCDSTPEFYVAEEKFKHYFSRFDVICVIDMEDTATMHQTIILELNDNAKDIVLDADVEKLFDMQGIYAIKATNLSYEKRQWIVSFTHPY